MLDSVCKQRWVTVVIGRSVLSLIYKIVIEVMMCEWKRLVNICHNWNKRDLEAKRKADEDRNPPTQRHHPDDIRKTKPSEIQPCQNQPPAPTTQPHILHAHAVTPTDSHACRANLVMVRVGARSCWKGMSMRYSLKIQLRRSAPIMLSIP